LLGAGPVRLNCAVDEFAVEFALVMGGDDGAVLLAHDIKLHPIAGDHGIGDGNVGARPQTGGAGQGVALLFEFNLGADGRAVGHGEVPMPGAGEIWRRRGRGGCGWGGWGGGRGWGRRTFGARKGDDGTETQQQ